MDTTEQLIVQKIVASMETYQASDLHLSVGNPPMMRVQGRLVPMPDQPLMTGSFIERIAAVWLDSYYLGILREKKDVVCARTFENKRRFKISAYYQQGYIALTLSLIPSVIPPLQQLGLPLAVQRLALLEKGLVCVTGPTMSEIQMTASSFIEYLNQNTQRHILTIEKPVEYLFQDNQSVVEQREVGVDVPHVEQALQAAFDEDVDVVFVAHIPTPSAWQSAITLANAGKMVFVLLHASSAVAALQSIVQSTESQERTQLRMDLAGALAGILNQHLVHGIQGDPVHITEVLIPNDAVRTIIQGGDLMQIQNILYTSREESIRSLDTALRIAVERGQISQQEAAKHAQNPRLFL